MSISDRLSAFAEYWKSVLKSATEPQELLNWLIALLAGVSGWLEHWAKAPAFLTWSAYLISGFLVLRGIFWPPFVVHERQQQALEALKKEAAEPAVSESKAPPSPIEEVRPPALTPQQRTKITLADYLLMLESRIKEVRNMSSIAYIESLDDLKEREGLTQAQLIERINSILDKVSLELIARIADYLEKNVGEEKGKLFRSTSGIVLTPPDRSDDMLAVYANRHKLYIDHLQHWAKNLVELVKGLD